ncbi:NAD(P)/FAD-dependent oxidoreductase [Nocardia carnea]|uniref:NAD(P)/FAD-dependent oxidoreductase n=1 Tax=Nocardia carnea TaxID=37328 RepID=UPI0024556ABA|nr:FAD-dependent oxidoreductase [Nocardia carnea]
MSLPIRHNIVIVGGSIAALTSAQVLRAEGFGGEITMLSAESYAPYSRVPLSKAILSGVAGHDSCTLPIASDDFEIRLGQRAVGLDDRNRIVHLAGGKAVRYDGLIIASGARARRLSRPGQSGEHVIRDMDDVRTLGPSLRRARSVVVVGAGFLGMEIASTCAHLGLAVTVIDRDPPLRRLLGTWLSDLVVRKAEAAGVNFIRAEEGVALTDGDVVEGVRYGDRTITADVVVSAIGDIPNSEWLIGSSFRSEGPLVVDPRCVAAEGIVAAGDVAAIRDASGVVSRLPHWNNAVRQARTAALALLHGNDAPVAAPDHYFWTEAFGLQIKVCGKIPDGITPTIIEHDGGANSFVLQWNSAAGSAVAAATVNRKMPVAKLRRLADETAVLAS